MVFTKQQDSDIKNIVKEVVKQCFADDSYTSVFAENISRQITKTLSDKFSKMEEELETIKTQIAQLQGENDMWKNKNEILESKIRNIENNSEIETRENLKEHETSNIFNKVMTLEQITKSRQLRILGLPESNNENLKEDLKCFFQDSLSVQVSSIEYCTRFGQVSDEKHRPVIVSFGNMQERNDVFYNKKKLKGKTVVIREELTKFNHNLFKYARQKFGNKTWTKNGKIIINSNGKKITVESKRKIDEFLNKTQTPAAIIV